MSARLFDRLRDPALFFALSCALALGWLLAGLVSLDTVSEVFGESGPIESASALFLILSAVALIGDMIRRRMPERWHLAVLIVAAALRELDWDKAFTESGVLSLKLYTRAHPIEQKVAGAVVLALLVWAGLRLLRRDLVPWLSRLRAGRVQAWLIAVTILLYAIAKSLDGLARKLAPWGIEISDFANRVAGRLEEGIELFGAILILQVVCFTLLHRTPAGPERRP